MEKNNQLLTDLLMQQKTTATYQRYLVALQHAGNLVKDPEKTNRLAKNLCKVCYYAPPRIGGAAMTNCNCASCNKKQVYGTTNVDLLCLECAKQNHLCKRCGSDLDLNINRKSLDLT